MHRKHLLRIIPFLASSILLTLGFLARDVDTNPTCIDPKKSEFLVKTGRSESVDSISEGKVLMPYEVFVSIKHDITDGPNLAVISFTFLYSNELEQDDQSKLGKARFLHASGNVAEYQRDVYVDKIKGENFFNFTFSLFPMIAMNDTTREQFTPSTELSVQVGTWCKPRSEEEAKLTQTKDYRNRHLMLSPGHHLDLGFDEFDPVETVVLATHSLSHMNLVVKFREYESNAGRVPRPGQHLITVYQQVAYDLLVVYRNTHSVRNFDNDFTSHGKFYPSENLDMIYHVAVSYCEFRQEDQQTNRRNLVCSKPKLTQLVRE